MFVELLVRILEGVNRKETNQIKTKEIKTKEIKTKG
jgi:hypothetical protein